MPSVGKITIDISAGTAQFVVDLEKANAKLKDFGGNAQSAGNPLTNLFRIGGSGFDSLGGSAERAGTRIVSSMQASSAALRVLEGSVTNNIRAGERFLSTFSGLGPILQGIFPLIGAFSVGAVAFEGIDRIGKMAGLWGDVGDKEKKAADEAKELDEQIKRIGEDIAKIDSSKFELQFGPAAAKAREAAQSVTSTSTAVSRTTLAMLQARASQQEAEITGGTGAVKYTVDQLSSRTDISSTLKAKIKALEETRQEMAKVEDELVKDQKQGDLLSLQSLKQSGDDYTAAQNDRVSRANQAADAQKRAWEKLRQADEAGLEAEAATHRLSLGEQIGYWQAHLETDLKGSDQEAAIQEKINRLRSEQIEAVARVAQRGSQAATENARKAEDAAHKLDELISRAEELNAKIGLGGTDQADQRTKMTDIGAKSGAQSEEHRIAMQRLENQRAIALSIYRSPNQQIGDAQSQMDLDKQASAAKIDGLQKQQDAAKAQGDAVKAAEMQLEIDKAISDQLQQQYADQTKIDELKKKQDLGAQISGDLSSAIHQQIPEALGSAFANILFRSGRHHESAGKELGSAAKGVGKNVVGQMATQGLEKLTSKFLGQGPQLAATTANTTALIANTTALTGSAAASAVSGAAGAASGFMGTIGKFLGPLKSIFGFADGGDPPVGHSSLVGERGPELFVPKQAGTIIPNHMLRSSAYANRSGPVPSGGPSSYASSVGELHFHAHGIDDPDDLVDMMAKRLPTRLKSTGPWYGPSTP